MLPLVKLPPLKIRDEFSRGLFACCFGNLSKHEIGSVIDWDEGFLQAEMAGARVSHLCLHEATRVDISRRNSRQ